jgi:hypothetical protein
MDPTLRRTRHFPQDHPFGRYDSVTMDRIAPTRRPAGDPQGYHSWQNLLFLHWEVPIEALRPLVPERLSIDTFEGRAYVGLVPFTMRDVHPAWCPPLPGISSFHETNVRTYVHLDGENPGVWFFSLDAANPAAVAAARVGWSLPYFYADMSLDVDGDRVDYRSRRHFSDGDAALGTSYRIGKALGAAAPGTLEHFLAERYFLYALDGGLLLRGQVHHTPYPLHEAHVERLHETLVAAARIPTHGPPVSALYAPRVDVEVFPLHQV